ncbi:MAG: hypothetical protein KKF85_00975 [Gammaproteobacteria bacterium]|nr:hypothetical protein [Rhodocyclaceae bacterium]MBU3908212.1 hypothetical protein [Gammaproteobacteria bacterium]MBU4003151.1 hypothetical protein [Gammaproteobacteria bacterium]MBU4019993.1 hypothetical protein [Gammaproteobacteria bacterium]MBU4096841.1 hypothetical protein [Gammaproteobacteria bacterium]
MQRSQCGAALLIFLVLLVMGGLTYVVSSFAPETIEARRAQTTNIALVQARDALIGYALKYRDEEASQGRPDRMYGYLPLPDLGSIRNNNVSCTGEGCDANTPTDITCDGNNIYPTMIGRLPWRTLGTEPLRDGHGECLWLIVSSLHLRKHCSSPTLPPMNWDTLGQLDVVVANGTNALVSALASAHERPVAVIFAPGPPLPGQDRSNLGGNDVSQCGGNYNVADYLDPATASALGGVTNYLAGTNLASGATGDSDPANDPDTPKSLVTRGKIFATGTTFLPSGCQGNNCTLVANDVGLPVTSDLLFGAIRKNVHFRTDINSMLDRMVGCLRDQIAASSSFTPTPITGYTSPADKSAGRIQNSSCYDDNLNPLGYFSHYREMIFVAKPTAGNFTVAGDPNCAGVLLFSGQRSTPQQRTTATQKNTPANYLEGSNLTSFTGAGSTFSGDMLLDRSPPQAAEQDIARCIPTGASFAPVASPTLSTLGFGQLVAYDAATRTLTLGKENVTTDFGAPGTALFGCAWLADSRSLGKGFRTYFSFQFKKVGSSVGSNGFVFAIADAMNNSLASCGAAGSHLGYSGENGFTPKVKFPKIGIEFDQSKNALFPTTSSEQSSTSAGRNDPCYTCGTGTADTHAAIVYWGHESADSITDLVILPDFDDNVHGFPTTAALVGNLRPPPTNPAVSSPGLKFVNLRGYPNSDFDSRLFYVRVEVTPSRNVNTSAAELSNTSVKTEVWIEGDPNSVNQIAALRNTTRPVSAFDTGYASTLSDNAVIFDVPVNGSSCNPGAPCPATQACGTDNICYRPALQTVRLGFSGSQRTSDQQVNITNFFTTWLP